VLGASFAFAQTSEVLQAEGGVEVYRAEIPEGVPEIPNPGAEFRGLVVKKENVEAFRSLLLAPLAAWIEGDSLVMRLARNLDYSWDYGSTWNFQTKDNLTSYNIDEQGALISKAVAPHAGFPFGTDSALSEVDDPAQRARMILWNISYAESLIGDVKYEGDLTWIGSQTVLRKSEAHFFRSSFLSPKAAPEKPNLHAEQKPSDARAKEEAPEPTPTPSNVAPTEVSFSGPGDLFRQELLQLRSPPVVFGYAQLGWRYRGEEEDSYWVYSPVIEKAREVLPANRSDSMLGGVLTMDDFFVWSTKVQSVNAKVLEEKVILVPFSSRFAHVAVLPNTGLPNTGPPNADADGVLEIPGLHEKLDGTRTMTLWNYETRQVARYAPWVPTSAHFVPREVWILELTPRDPYYETGREILIVDKRSMLPVYKIVYDKYGDFSRIVMAAWGFAQVKGSSAGLPFVGFLLGIDRGARQAMTFTPHRVKMFAPETSGKKMVPEKREMLSLFDVRNHGKQLKPEPPKVFVPSSVTPSSQSRAPNREP